MKSPSRSRIEKHLKRCLSRPLSLSLFFAPSTYGIILSSISLCCSIVATSTVARIPENISVYPFFRARSSTPCTRTLAPCCRDSHPRFSPLLSAKLRDSLKLFTRPLGLSRVAKIESSRWRRARSFRLCFRISRQLFYSARPCCHFSRLSSREQAFTKIRLGMAHCNFIRSMEFW